MRKIQKIVPLLCFFMLLSCVKDEYDPDACITIPKILVEFDWSLVEEPDDEEWIEVLITDQDDTSLDLSVHNDGSEVELDPDMYEFVGDESHRYVTLQRCTVSVNTDANGNYLEPAYFTGGSTEQQINDYEMVQVVVIPMRRQTRELIIRVILNGEGLNYLGYAEGEITGVTMSRHINDAFPPLEDPGNHPAYVTSSVHYSLSSTDHRVFSDMHNLLGVDSESPQVLHFTAHYTDGSIHPVDVDVTSQMAGFHTENINEPWVLELILNLGPPSIGATIEDWYGGSESQLVAQ